MARTMNIRKLLGAVPVLPVVTISSAADACDLARALLGGGIGAIEITLRTPESCAAIEAVARGLPQVAVGAGTVLTPDDLRRAGAAGATFAVSPGTTRELLAAARDQDMPYLPGVATASEIQKGMAAGYDCFKFFPAVGLGGPAALRALAGPFHGLALCATGGITVETAGLYLELPNVLAVGGSWIAPADAIANRDWRGIAARAREAAALFLPKMPR